MRGRLPFGIIHYHTDYDFTKSGHHRFVTACGLYSKKHPYINSTIIESRCSCKKCNKILKKLAYNENKNE